MNARCFEPFKTSLKRRLTVSEVAAESENNRCLAAGQLGRTAHRRVDRRLGNRGHERTTPVGAESADREAADLTMVTATSLNGTGIGASGLCTVTRTLSAAR